MTAIPTTSIGFSFGDDAWLVGNLAGETRLRLDDEERLFLHPEAGPGGNAVRAVAASADGALVGAAHQNGDVVVWEVESGRVVERFVSEHPLLQLVLAGPRRYEAVDVKLRARVWRPQGTGLERQTLTDPRGKPVEADALARSGERLLIQSGFDYLRYRDGELIFEERVRPVKAHQFLYPDGLVGLSPGGRWYFVHWDDYLVVDTLSGERRLELPIVEGARAAALSEEGPLLVAGTADGRLVVIGDSGQKLLERSVSEDGIRQVAFAARGGRVGFIDERGRSEVIDL